MKHLCRSKSLIRLALVFTTSLSASCNTAKPISKDAVTSLDSEKLQSPIILTDDTSRINGRVVYEPYLNNDALVRHSGSGVSIGKARHGTKADSQPGDITLNYVDTDIHEIVRIILGNILKVNYSIDPGLVGTATIQTIQPLKREQLLSTLQGLLAQNGAVMLYQNGLFRIAPAGNNSVVPPVVTTSSAADGSQVVPLRYASARQLAAMLAPYVGEGAKLIADPGRNVLVVSGSSSARSSLIDLIQTFDVDYLAGQSYALFPVKSGTPDKVARDLQHALEVDGEGPLSGTLKIVPIEEANAVMVIAQQRSYLERASSLITELDRVADSSNRNVHVYYLKNVRAVDIQPVLQRAFNPARATASMDDAGAGSLPPNAEASEIASPPMRRTSDQSDPAGNTQGTPASGSNPGSQTNNGPIFKTSPTDAVPTSELSSPSLLATAGAPQIIADRKSNSLLVVATEDEYSKVEATIRRLDVLPLQVFIEATIAEVSLNDQLQYGTQFYLRTHSIESTLSNAVSSAVALNPSTAIANAALFPGTLQPSYPGFSVGRTSGSPQFAIEALKQVTNVRVVSSPTLLVLDNEPASFQVGDDVPIITQSATSVVTSNAEVVNSVNYRETGVILNVTPRINSGGLVTLDIEQEVSQVVNTTTSTIDSPTIQQRKLKTRVVVQDSDTIALAGLISDSRTIGDSGIPYLKDIPVLGSLFSTKNKSGVRTELIVLITPRVVHDQRDARLLTEGLRHRLSASQLVGP